MAQEKISFDRFMEAVDVNHHPFIQELHGFFTDNGCKETIEEKKSGLLVSYKHTKTKKSVANLLFRKKGLLIRIYGENVGQYPDFLNTLPDNMVQSIDSASECKRIVHNTCSPKCIGYDVTIRGVRYQKCRYNAFEFLVEHENYPFIRTFVENELNARNATAAAASKK